MDMKSCPSCGADVPSAAARCKVCFHDFDEAPKDRATGPLFLLALAASMAVMAAGTFYYLSSMPTDERILVDEATHTIQWIRQYKDGSLETDQVKWEDVAKLEYLVTSTGDFEIAAITRSGDRKVVMYDPDKPLHATAKRYAELMGKELVIKENTAGFGNGEE